MSDPLKDLERLDQVSQDSAESWASGPEGHSILDEIIQSDPAHHDVRLADASRHRRRMPAVAACLVVVGLIAGGAAFIAARDEGDRVDANRTEESAEQARGTAEGPSGLTADLPIGADDSPYWVAHELPDDYALLDASMRSAPIVGDPGVPAPSTGYGPRGNNRYDTNLWVTTVQWDAPDSFRADALAAMGESFRSVDIRGKDGFEYPLSGDGRVYGTTLLWEERPGLWIEVEAAEPLTSDDAHAVADGLQPFPEEKWDLLVTSVDQNWHLEPDQMQAATKVAVVDATESTGWALDALVPPRWGELSVDRRWPCARLTVHGVAVANPACDYPGWYVFDGRVYVVGMAPDQATSMKVRAGDAVVDAELHSVEPTPGFQYWVAEMGDIGCSEYQAELEPAGLDDQLSRYMTGQNGPTEGCGIAGPDGEVSSEGLPPNSETIPVAAEAALDGPVMRYPEPGGDLGMAALVRGRLELDGGCLYLASNEVGERYPVVWPAGTTWDAENEVVIGPSDAHMPVGGEVYGGGGYLKVEEVERLLGAEARRVAARCVDNEYGEIAFVNNQDDAIGPSR